jgi:uncharacterized protein (TIGR01777 family)
MGGTRNQGRGRIPTTRLDIGRGRPYFSLHMRIGIFGGTGFIGRHLSRRLRTRGHRTVLFTREKGQRAPTGVASRPLPVEGEIDLKGLDGVVNLAGESVMGWWTAGKKRRIRASRIGTTERIADSLAKLGAGKGPGVWLNASAIGLYGDCGDDEVDEARPPGQGFLADVCREWEAAAEGAAASGTRVLVTRFGLVLGPDGGAWPLLRGIFGARLGGRLGSGQQWMSPIHVDDVTGLILFLLETESASGVYNAVCPHPLRNTDLTRAVAHALKTPAVIPAPEVALRLGLGEASHLLLDSARVVPKRALAAGYSFQSPNAAAIFNRVAHAAKPA